MMRKVAAVAMVGMAAATLAAAPAERLVPGDGVVDAAVNDVAVRLRIDPAATNLALLTQSVADRARLRAGPATLIWTVGREQVRVATGRARFGGAWTTLGWAPRPYVAGLDGVIGPGGVEAPVVRFVFQMPRAGERTVTLPMVGQDGPGGSVGGLFARVDVGGRPLRIRFDPHHPRTLATASAATRIALANDGAMLPGRSSAEIAFGIERPVRDMALGRPLQVGPLALNRIGVRIGDVGSAASIREQGGDRDEIVVNAGERADPDRDRLAIGADWLRRCSTLVFNKPARQITLSCL